MDSHGPLLSGVVRMWWLAALWQLFDDAAEVVPGINETAPCVASALLDPHRRIASFGARDGMVRSLGSPYACFVALFLGGSLRNLPSRRIFAFQPLAGSGFHLTIRRGHATMLVGHTHSLREYRIADGARLQEIGRWGKEPLQFCCIRQICTAPDGWIFVVDSMNSRVQVLTPELTFSSCIGEGILDMPSGVCANADVVVVSDTRASQIHVFDRQTGRHLRHFGSLGTGAGQLRNPSALCFTSNGHRVAVADLRNDRVSCFAVDGTFVRIIRARTLRCPTHVACSAYDEIIVSNYSRSVFVFNLSGELLKTLRHDLAMVSGTALYDGKLFVQGCHAVSAFE